MGEGWRYAAFGRSGAFGARGTSAPHAMLSSCPLQVTRVRANDPQTRRGAAKDAKEAKSSVADARGQSIATLRGKGGKRKKKPPVCPTRCSTESGNATEKQIVIVVLRQRHLTSHRRETCAGVLAA
jgi:hypothetical protein